MGAELTGFTGGAALGAARAAARGSARSTQSLQFVSGVTIWDQLPAPTLRADVGGGVPLAESVDVFTTFSLTLDGHPHQVRSAWRAYTDRIFVARDVRALVDSGDGRKRPVGPWVNHDTRIVKAASEPVKTIGRVGADVGAGTGGAPASGSSPAATLPGDQRTAARAFSTLPGAVRASAARAVPEPTVWLGDLIQRTQGGAPVEHEVSLLRMDEARAVVLVATRTIPEHRRAGGELFAAAAPGMLEELAWDVTQVTYALGEAPPAIDGARRLRIGRRR